MYSKSYAGSEDGLIENPLTAGPALPKWCTPHFSGRPSRVNIAAIGIPFIGGTFGFAFAFGPFDLRTWLAEDPSVTN